MLESGAKKSGSTIEGSVPSFIDIALPSDFVIQLLQRRTLVKSSRNLIEPRACVFLGLAVQAGLKHSLQLTRLAVKIGGQCFQHR